MLAILDELYRRTDILPVAKHCLQLLTGQLQKLLDQLSLQHFLPTVCELLTFIANVDLITKVWDVPQLLSDC